MACGTLLLRGGVVSGINLQTAWSILQQTGKKDFSGAPPASTLDLKFVLIPHRSPLVSIFIDRVQKEVMEKPNMTRDIRIQPALGLKLVEKVFPLGPEVAGDLDPQAFNPRVVDTPLLFWALEI